MYFVHADMKQKVLIVGEVALGLSVSRPETHGDKTQVTETNEDHKSLL